MRQIKNARRRFADALRSHYQPDGDQLRPSELMDVELGIHLLTSVAPDEGVGGVPALLDGYRSWREVLSQPLADLDIRLANARTLLWRLKPYGWDSVIKSYLAAPEEVLGFDIDADGLARARAGCRIFPERFELYEELLTAPLPFATNSIKVAEPGSYRMASTATGVSVDIPEDFPVFAPMAVHDLSVRDRKPLTVRWTELVDTARAMDATDRGRGLSNAWEGRLQELTVEMRGADNTFTATDTLTIEGILHMVGMVSVGKTTLVMVLAVWAAQNGHNVTIVVGDNTAALRASHQLDAYDGIQAAPIMGLNRDRHTERLHRIQPSPPGRLLPVQPYGFELVSTACAVSALRDSEHPLEVREAPCDRLIAPSDRAPSDEWRSGVPHVCPTWHGCQRHVAARDLVQANVWIATPWSLVHTKVPAPLSSAQMRYLEAAWRRSDLIIVDEADQVQANLDEMFANAQVLLGRSDDAWIDEMGRLVPDKIRDQDRAPTRSRSVRRFSRTISQARTAAEVMYHQVQRDRSRPGKPVLSWFDHDYFTAWSLFDDLAQEWAGFPKGSRRDRPDDWEADTLYQHLRDSFNAFIDDPTGTSHTGVADNLATFARSQLTDVEEDVSDSNVRNWLTELAQIELVPGRRLSLKAVEHGVWRLEFAVALAVVSQRLNLMLFMWPQAAAELDMYDVMTAELRKPPADLSVVVPESPMGNVLGFQYVEDDRFDARDRKLGEFRFFRYSGVGRMLLLDLPGLFPAEGAGPNVLLLSGTSWAGTSPRYHVDVPVRAILRPSAEKLARISETTFSLEILKTGASSSPIFVSGRYGDARAAALRSMVEALVRPGAGPGNRNRLERERDQLPAGRQKILVLVGSYVEARTVSDEFMRLKSTWKGQVRCLIGDDELESGWDDAHHLRRGDVTDFGTDDSWILVAPIRVERGHNILNEVGVAAIGAAFFLVRPHPRPKDLTYVTQHINQFACDQLRSQIDGSADPDQTLEAAGEQRRRAAHRAWRRLLHAMVAYSQLVACR